MWGAAMSESDALLAAAERLADHNVALRRFLLRLLDPDDLGHAVSAEVRDLAQQLVNLPRQHGTN